MPQQVYKGIGSGSGFAIAPAVVVHRGELAIPKLKIPAREIRNEVARFRDTIAMTQEQLFRVRAATAKAMGEDAAAVIDAQLLVLSDPSCVDETERLIRMKKVNAEHAFDTVLQGMIEALSASNGLLFRERAQDFSDVERRVIANLMGLKHQAIPFPEHEAILVIDNLAPSETAHLFGSKYIGLITEAGGFTSHVAIMTRTMDLPAVLGIEQATEVIPENARIVLDSMHGNVIVDPDADALKEYSARQRLFTRRRNIVGKVISEAPTTPDGHRVAVGANMELPEEVPLAKHYGAEGIGLFRTEVLYGAREDLPGEDEQFEAYRTVARGNSSGLARAQANASGTAQSRSAAKHLTLPR